MLHIGNTVGAQPQRTPQRCQRKSQLAGLPCSQPFAAKIQQVAGVGTHVQTDVLSSLRAGQALLPGRIPSSAVRCSICRHAGATNVVPVRAAPGRAPRSKRAKAAAADTVTTTNQPYNLDTGSMDYYGTRNGPHWIPPGFLKVQYWSQDIAVEVLLLYYETNRYPVNLGRGSGAGQGGQ